MAVLVVVLYHAGVPLAGGGFIGVDVFFVLSGYLITGMLLSEVDSSGTIDLTGFYARRARRLLPAAALVIAATLAAGIALYSTAEMRRLAASALAASAYFSNFWFIRESGNYFGSDAETNPLVHTWSLSVEEQFYFVWPILILLIARAGGARTRIAILGGILVASFMASYWYTYLNQPQAFYGTHLRAWEFAAGGIAVLTFQEDGTRGTAARRIAGWLGLAMILGATFMLSRGTPFPGEAALLPVVGTVLVLHAGATLRPGGVAALLSIAPLQWLGRHSYSWYLWHWPVLVFGGVILVRPTVAQNLVLCTLGLALAAITYRFVENPVRRMRVLIPRPRLSLALGLVLTLAFVSVAFTTQSVAARKTALAAETAEGSLPRPLVDGCRLEPLEVVPRICAYGPMHADTVVALFGDSHAEHWFPAVEPIADARGWRIVTYIKASCPAADVTVHHRRMNRPFLECDEWREEVLDLIRADPPTFVMLAQSTSYLEARPDRREPASGAISLEDWERGLVHTLLHLRESGIVPVLISPTPLPGFNVPECINAPPLRRRITGPCVASEESSWNPDIWHAALSAASSVAGTIMLDLSPEFCDGGQCELQRGEVILFRDASHLTANGAQLLAPALERELLRALKPRTTNSHP